MQTAVVYYQPEIERWVVRILGEDPIYFEERQEALDYCVEHRLAHKEVYAP